MVGGSFYGIFTSGFSVEMNPSKVIAVGNSVIVAILKERERKNDVVVKYFSISRPLP